MINFATSIYIYTYTYIYIYICIYIYVCMYVHIMNPGLQTVLAPIALQLKHRGAGSDSKKLSGAMTFVVLSRSSSSSSCCRRKCHI